MNKKILLLFLLIFSFCSLLSVSIATENPETIANLFVLWDTSGVYFHSTQPYMHFSADEMQDYSLYAYKLSDDYLIVYRMHSDKEVLFINFPLYYLPMDDMCIDTLSYFLQLSLDDARELYHNLQYNMIDGISERTIGTVEISLIKITEPILKITRVLSE